MKKRIKILIGITCLSVLIGTFTLVNINNKKSINNDVSVNFSEKLLSDEEMINISDVIMKGKVISIKEQGTRTVETTSTNNQPIKVTGPYITYLVEETERLSNPYDSKQIELTLFDDPSKRLDIGESCLLFLDKNTSKNSSYRLVSYSNGIFSFDRNILKPRFHEKDKDQKDKNYDELKQKIKSLK